MDWPRFREVEVAASGSGMRLDRFLALRFPDRSRSFFAARIKAGEVTNPQGRTLPASHRVVAGEVLRLTTEGIAPTTQPPPFPDILWEGSDVVAVNKPPGLICHPAGTTFQWGLISLAKLRWPEGRVDLVHRIDRDTSGALLLTRSIDANRWLKEAVKQGSMHKEYEAIVKGLVPWDHRVLHGPIGPADGPIRIQMAVRPDGQAARTEVTVLRRGSAYTHVRCVLHTGRTHQIRVHLADAGHGLVGDRLYGVPPDLFLGIWEHGVTEEALRRAGAPRHALHARRLVFPLPGDPSSRQEVIAPFPDDLVQLWDSQGDAEPGRCT